MSQTHPDERTHHLAPIFEYTGDPHDALPLLDTHLEWIRRHQHEGRILFAGPSEDGELGIMVFGHLTRSAAEAPTRTDPFVANGHRTFSLTRWDVH